MPIDASIYGQQQPFRLNTPFEALGQIGQLQQQQQVIASAKALEQERQAKLAEDAKKQADADQFNTIISNVGLFNRDTMRAQVQQHAPDKLQGLEKWYADFDKTAEEYKKAKNEAAAAAALAQQRQGEVVGTVANGIAAHGYTATAFANGLNELGQKFPESQSTWDNYQQLALQNGPAWIKEHVDGLRKMGDLSTAAKIPGEQADSALKQQVADNAYGGMTAEQHQQADDAAARLKVSQRQAAVSEGELALRKKESTDKNQPVDITSSVNTTASGRQYVDLSTFQTPKAREDARKAADTAGVMAVGKDVADGLRAADTARGNFNTMIGQLRGKLPTDPTGRIITGPKNTLEKYFQTDADLAAFGSWRQAAIQGVQALAEKGMGLRLNQTEINNMIDSLPKLTDTWDTAQKKIGNFTSMLDNKEKNALTRDRSSLTPPPALTADDLIKKYGGR